jgi:hypothetical protein
VEEFDVPDDKLIEKDEFVGDAREADLCLCILPWDFCYVHKLNIQAAVYRGVLWRRTGATTRSTAGTARATARRWDSVLQG